MSKRKRGSFTPEYKAEVVGLVRSSDKTVGPVARELDLIVTTEANDLVRSVHDRMPVLLSPEGAEAWLSRGDGAVLAPASTEWLTCREVSPLVNSVANDGPELLGAPRREPQLKLL